MSGNMVMANYNTKMTAPPKVSQDYLFPLKTLKEREIILPILFACVSY